MLFHAAFLAYMAASAAAVPAILKRGVDFDWGTEKVRGVNIGGWLLIEPWITPSLFEQFPESDGIVDEYTLTEKLGRERAVNEVLKPHWDTWATFDDFVKLKETGLNLLRIPIGFWAFNTFDYPYASGASPYLDKAIEWAREVDLKVVIDIHGLPRSQNGFDNSGQRLDGPLWGTENSYEESLEVVTQIATKYSVPEYHDVVVAVEVVNEPAYDKLPEGQLKQYYLDSYDIVREYNGEMPIVISDGFKNPDFWNDTLTPKEGAPEDVIIDHHMYSVFDNYLVSLDFEGHRQFVCEYAGNYSTSDKVIFVGEWSGAMTDCAKYLNGYLRGARYDGTFPNSTYHGSCEGKNDVGTWSQELKDNTRWFIETQLRIYEGQNSGWVFWNFKTELSHEWDYLRLSQEGVYPNPVTDLKYPAVCFG